MQARALVAFLLAFSFALPRSALALEWEIERNFRYFLYPSDVAAQRVARDIYMNENGGKSPTPAQSEAELNGPDFWATPLAKAGALRDRWPVAWPRDDKTTVFDLVKRLRQDEGRALLATPQDLSRLGWADLLAEGRDARRPTGFTATCWNPGVRLHNNCARWGDYVRPPGWIVRVFDPSATAAGRCSWTVEGGVLADAGSARFQNQVGEALRNGRGTVDGDCRQLRIVAPSDPKDPRTVAGRATVTRVSPGGAEASIMVTPRDRLVIGFGDSFTSGEGNPERPAVFTGGPWTADRFGGSNLPARLPDPVSARDFDTRAQWTDRWCHRSVYSWQIRTALAAALSDLHQSVTILPYGCSGATIPAGLLFEYNGVEWDRGSDHGIIGSRAEIGLAYQEICQPAAFKSPYCRHGDDSPFCGGTAPPSTDEEKAADFIDKTRERVRRTVARCGPVNAFKRSADAVLVDIGINDVGFSSWVAGLVLQAGLRIRVNLA